MPDQKPPQQLLESLRRLSDGELVARLKSLAARERRATALLVAHLAELDTRDLHLRAGYPSLFIYCRDVLALSEHEAYNRMEAARTARRFPLVLDRLASGEVNLTTVRLLAPPPDRGQPRLGARVGLREEESRGRGDRGPARASPRRPGLRPEGARQERCGRSCRRLVLFRGRLRSSGAAFPAPPDDAWPARTKSSPPPTGCPRGLAEQPPAAAAPQAPLEVSAELTPLSPDRYRYQLTIGEATLEKLRLAKDMLRHALPSGADEALLDRALTLLLDDLARKKFGSDESARPSRGAAKDSRHVPVAVKRAVWVRDLGRCAFVAEDGRRCGERAFVEFHHLLPHAAGGEATVGNIELRCREHHGYETRRFFPRAEDRDFVLERIASGGAAPSRAVTRSSAASPAALPRAVRSAGATPPVGPPRVPRQAMLL